MADTQVAPETKLIGLKHGTAPSEMGNRTFMPIAKSLPARRFHVSFMYSSTCDQIELAYSEGT